METPKQRIGPAAGRAALGLKERADELKPLGWKGRRAEWIALACFHGGVFTRAQWTSFLGCHHEKVGRAVRKLVGQGVAVEEKPPGIKGIGRICRIHGRPIYKALGLGDRRRRRITSPEVVTRRLLGLDYVLEHPRLPWLPTEADRVAAFEALGIGRGLFPQRVYRGALGGLRRFFPLGLPIALDTERAVFVYAEPGYETATAIRSWGAKHGDLWKALWDLGLKIEVVAVVRRWKEYGRTSRVLTNWSRYPRPSEIDEETGRDIARIEQAILRGDVHTLDEYGGLQAAMKRANALEKRARRRAGRGLTERVQTWSSDRLAGARIWWES